LIQALRPHPQWNGVPPFLGPPLGNTWYDSLQAKVVQRLSHGLTVQGTYTWQKEVALGLNSDTSYVTPSPFLINDVFNRNQTKQLVLKPAAWTDAPPRQVGTSAPYYTDSRWQRRPAEAFSLGRDFVVEQERNIKLQVRAYCQNIFNRLFLASPIPISSGTFSV